jgi:hypothetical protein
LPTSDEKEKKVLVNGKEEAPKKKTKVPLTVDWQAVARKKQSEVDSEGK